MFILHLYEGHNFTFFWKLSLNISFGVGMWAEDWLKLFKGKQGQDSWSDIQQNLFW